MTTADTYGPNPPGGMKPTKAVKKRGERNKSLEFQPEIHTSHVPKPTIPDEKLKQFLSSVGMSGLLKKTNHPDMTSLYKYLSAQLPHSNGKFQYTDVHKARLIQELSQRVPVSQTSNLIVPEHTRLPPIGTKPTTVMTQGTSKTTKGVKVLSVEIQTNNRSHKSALKPKYSVTPTSPLIVHKDPSLLQNTIANGTQRTVGIIPVLLSKQIKHRPITNAGPHVNSRLQLPFQSVQNYQGNFERIRTTDFANLHSLKLSDNSNYRPNFPTSKNKLHAGTIHAIPKEQVYLTPQGSLKQPIHSEMVGVLPPMIPVDAPLYQNRRAYFPTRSADNVSYAFSIRKRREQVTSVSHSITFPLDKQLSHQNRSSQYKLSKIRFKTSTILPKEADDHNKDSSAVKSLRNDQHISVRHQNYKNSRNLSLSKRNIQRMALKGERVISDLGNTVNSEVNRHLQNWDLDSTKIKERVTLDPIEKIEALTDGSLKDLNDKALAIDNPKYKNRLKQNVEEDLNRQSKAFFFGLNHGKDGQITAYSENRMYEIANDVHGHINSNLKAWGLSNNDKSNDMSLSSFEKIHVHPNKELKILNREAMKEDDPRYQSRLKQKVEEKIDRKSNAYIQRLKLRKGEELAENAEYRMYDIADDVNGRINKKVRGWAYVNAPQINDVPFSSIENSKTHADTELETLNEEVLAEQDSLYRNKLTENIKKKLNQKSSRYFEKFNDIRSKGNGGHRRLRVTPDSKLKQRIEKSPLFEDPLYQEKMKNDMEKKLKDISAKYLGKSMGESHMYDKAEKIHKESNKFIKHWNLDKVKGKRNYSLQSFENTNGPTNRDLKDPNTLVVSVNNSNPIINLKKEVEESLNMMSSTYANGLNIDGVNGAKDSQESPLNSLEQIKPNHPLNLDLLLDDIPSHKKDSVKGHLHSNSSDMINYFTKINNFDVPIEKRIEASDESPASINVATEDDLNNLTSKVAIDSNINIAEWNLDKVKSSDNVQLSPFEKISTAIADEIDPWNIDFSDYGASTHPAKGVIKSKTSNILKEWLSSTNREQDNEDPEKALFKLNSQLDGKTMTNIQKWTMDKEKENLTPSLRPIERFSTFPVGKALSMISGKDQRTSKGNLGGIVDQHVGKAVKLWATDNNWMLSRNTDGTISDNLILPTSKFEKINFNDNENFEALPVNNNADADNTKIQPSKKQVNIQNIFDEPPSLISPLHPTNQGIDLSLKNAENNLLSPFRDKELKKSDSDSKDKKYASSISKAQRKMLELQDTLDYAFIDDRKHRSDINKINVSRDNSGHIPAMLDNPFTRINSSRSADKLDSKNVKYFTNSINASKYFEQINEEIGHPLQSLVAKKPFTEFLSRKSRATSLENSVEPEVKAARVKPMKMTRLYGQALAVEAMEDFSRVPTLSLRSGINKERPLFVNSNLYGGLRFKEEMKYIHNSKDGEKQLDAQIYGTPSSLDTTNVPSSKVYQKPIIVNIPIPKHALILSGNVTRDVKFQPVLDMENKSNSALNLDIDPHGRAKIQLLSEREIRQRTKINAALHGRLEAKAESKVRMERQKNEFAKSPSEIQATETPSSENKNEVDHPSQEDEIESEPHTSRIFTNKPTTTISTKSLWKFTTKEIKPNQFTEISPTQQTQLSEKEGGNRSSLEISSLTQPEEHQSGRTQELKKTPKITIAVLKWEDIGSPNSSERFIKPTYLNEKTASSTRKQTRPNTVGSHPTSKLDEVSNIEDDVNPAVSVDLVVPPEGILQETSQTAEDRKGFRIKNNEKANLVKENKSGERIEMMSRRPISTALNDQNSANVITKTNDLIFTYEKSRDSVRAPMFGGDILLSTDIAEELRKYILEQNEAPNLEEVEVIMVVFIFLDLHI